MLPIPTLDENTEVLVAVAKRLFSDHDFSNQSPNWKAIRVLAFLLHDAKVHNVRAKNGLMARTAIADEQDDIGFAFRLARKSATAARKDFSLRVFGTIGAACPAASTLIHASGLRYETIGTATIGAAGYADVSIVSIDVGSAARLNAGESLNFESTPINLNETAELQLDIDQDGVDQETDGQYAARLLARTQDAPRGGSDSDYREWLTKYNGIATAYVYAGRRGLGTVDVAALHAGSGISRTLIDSERLALAVYLDELRPVTDSVRVLTVNPKPVNVEVLLRDNGSAAAARDWDDSSAGIVQSWDAGTRTLEFLLRPTALKAKDLIVLTTILGTGEFYRVEALSGPASVVLERAPAAPPLIGDLVYAGGPAAVAARKSIIDHFDTLGPSNTDSHRAGTWEGTLRIGSLQSAARVAGIVDATVLDPITAVDGADLPWPNDVAIELIVTGKVIVRWL
jgi:uncharacterized phage protein gp47/JayE